MEQKLSLLSSLPVPWVEFFVLVFRECLNVDSNMLCLCSPLSPAGTGFISIFAFDIAHMSRGKIILDSHLVLFKETLFGQYFSRAAIYQPFRKGNFEKAAFCPQHFTPKKFGICWKISPTMRSSILFSLKIDLPGKCAAKGPNKTIRPPFVPPEKYSGN